MKRYVYPVTLTPDEEAGGFVVTFPDVRGAVTQGDDREEALTKRRIAWLPRAPVWRTWIERSGVKIRLIKTLAVLDDHDPVDLLMDFKSQQTIKGDRAARVGDTDGDVI